MINHTLQLPDPVAAEFYSAADLLNGRFSGASPKIEAKSQMAFALARHETGETATDTRSYLSSAERDERSPAQWQGRRRDP